MKQSITFDADDVRQDHIAGEKSEAGLSFSRAPVLLIPKEESQLWRKVDLKLMPIIALMYLLCFMDRGTFFKIPQCCVVVARYIQETLVTLNWTD